MTNPVTAHTLPSLSSPPTTTTTNTTTLASPSSPLDKPLPQVPTVSAKDLAPNPDPRQGQDQDLDSDHSSPSPPPPPLLENNTASSMNDQQQRYYYPGGSTDGTIPVPGQAYTMQNLSRNSHGAPQRQPQPHHHQDYQQYGFNHESAPYSGPQYYNGGYDVDSPPFRSHTDLEDTDPTDERKQRPRRVRDDRKRSSGGCLPCFPCIRSTCGRVSCCICLLLILIVIILAIVIVTVFKLPTVDYMGMDQEPVFSLNQGTTTFGVDFVANIQVQNPNPIGFLFESIVATAHYPGYGPPIGGGNVTNQDFPSKSTRTIHFPISARYNRLDDPGFTVIKSILTQCGILGGADAGQLTIDYDLKVTMKIFGIDISPGVKNQHASFDCPKNIQDIGISLPGGIGSLIGRIVG